MLFLISYDITDDRKRNRIADLLGYYGTRVQYSVFECELDKDELKEIINRIESEIELDEEDSVRFYCICEQDRKKIIHLGTPIEGLSDLHIV